MPLLEEQAAAPEFSVSNQEGAAISLSQLKGQWVVLWWYPKAATPG